MVGDVSTVLNYVKRIDSKLCQPVSPDSDVDDLFETYDTVLWDTADRFAPVHVIRRRRGRPTPWFDTECRSLRRECRRLERQYRRTYTADDRRSWVDAWSTPPNLPLEKGTVLV